MPFNIEFNHLSPDGVSIKLQCVNNIVNFYCDGDYATRDTITHLVSHISAEHSELFVNTIRGSDEPHVKRHHTHLGETNITHTHFEFKNMVGVAELKLLLEGIVAQQQQHHFYFTDATEVAEILAVYEEYLKGYQNSTIEQQYREDQRLTPVEAEELLGLTKLSAAPIQSIVRQQIKEGFEREDSEAAARRRRKTEIDQEPQIKTLSSSSGKKSASGFLGGLKGSFAKNLLKGIVQDASKPTKATVQQSNTGFHLAI